MIGRAFLSDTLPGSPPAAPVPDLLGVATLVFSLIHLVPGDPVQAMLGESAPPQDIAEMRGRLGLDRPLHAQYGAFLKGLGTGNLGSSLRTNQPVTAAIAERLPATFELAFAAMLVATAIAIPLGILAAVRVGTHVDYAATTLALVGISIPDFWLGPLLAIVFSIMLGWLPVSGRGTAAHLVLPAIHARCAAVGRARPHDARERTRGAAGAVCAGGAGARRLTRSRGPPSRFPEQPDSDRDRAWTAIRRAVDRRRHHRDDFRVAGGRPALDFSRSTSATIRSCRAAFC